MKLSVTLILFLTMTLGGHSQDDPEQMVEHMDSLRLEMQRIAGELDSLWRDYERQQGYVNCAEGFYAVNNTDSTEHHSADYVKECLWSSTHITLNIDQTFMYKIEREGENGHAVGTWSTTQDNTIILVSDKEKSKQIVDDLNAHGEEPWVYEPIVGQLFVIEQDGLRDYDMR